VTPASPAPPAGAAGRRRVLALTMVAAVALCALGAALATRRGALATSTPPVLGTVPTFALVERSGRPLTSAALAGRIWIADFIFTRCGGICPAMTARMARLREEFPADVTFVSFTVDPAHDTPDTLARYAARAGAREGWLFATGEPRALQALAVDGFKLAAQEVPAAQQQAGGDGPFVHSSRFVLVDGAGRIRGYYDSADEEAMGALRKDLEAVRGAVP
jgi:protein SCO1/2